MSPTTCDPHYYDFINYHLSSYSSFANTQIMPRTPPHQLGQKTSQLHRVSQIQRFVGAVGIGTGTQNPWNHNISLRESLRQRADHWNCAPFANRESLWSKDILSRFLYEFLEPWGVGRAIPPFCDLEVFYENWGVERGIFCEKFPEERFCLFLGECWRESDADVEFDFRKHQITGPGTLR